MKKTTKRMLLLSCSLMAAGLLFTGIGFAIESCRVLPGLKKESLPRHLKRNTDRKKKKHSLLKI